VAAEGGVEEVLREDVLRQVYRWPVTVGRDPDTGAPQVTPLLEEKANEVDGSPEPRERADAADAAPEP
jgi:hypothetical protein